MSDICLSEYIKDICERAKAAVPSIASLPESKKNAILRDAAKALTDNADAILSANKADLDAAEENGVPKVMLDRLALSYDRIKGIASQMEDVVALPCPVGSGECFVRPNGLVIRHVKVPLGVVAMIYEARPNVTADAAALCIKTGNAVILRGGKEALASSTAIVKVIRDTLSAHGVSPDAVSLVESRERESASLLMSMRGYIDMLIPRGGKGLIKSVVENAKVPVIETGAGNCHLYVDETADIDSSVTVAVNAKTSRPAVCNAIETLLVHKAAAESFLPLFASATRPLGLEIRGCEETCRILPEAIPASEEDYDTEYDDLIIAVKVVDDIDSAISHIRRYSTGHSEAIMTSDIAAANKFTSSIDSAALYVNASTRFTDGGEFGLGAEIGISTQKLHVRGPMGLAALTTDKYIIEGSGQIR
ncbi:MAG: glutamate-5-semialdehyde dehydrogenase [Clostridia bacterium]|nr:glutamate-5-semialdehyde dehydrogenase [Clostridia bacterium]